MQSYTFNNSWQCNLGGEKVIIYYITLIGVWIIFIAQWVPSFLIQVFKIICVFLCVSLKLNRFFNVFSRICDDVSQSLASEKWLLQLHKELEKQGVTLPERWFIFCKKKSIVKYFPYLAGFFFFFFILWVLLLTFLDCVCLEEKRSLMYLQFIYTYVVKWDVFLQD